MGQTCTTVQHQFNRNTLGLSNQVTEKDLQKQSQVNRYLSKQKQTIKKITFIQNSQELIYQFDDMYETVEKLKVKHWNKQDMFEEMSIQQFIDDRSFIVKAKFYGKTSYVWKVFNTINVENISSQNIMNFGLLYYNFSKIKQIDQINHCFLYADQCFVNFQNDQKNKATFIIESQTFEDDIVSLRELGRFMRKNDICWQDKQFVQIIIKCVNRIENMHKCNLLIFQEFLITQKGDVYCIGGLVGQDTQKSNHLTYEDFYQLAVYLLETLYGKNIMFDSNLDLLSLIKQQERMSKFVHSESLSLLLDLFKRRQLIKKKSEIHTVERTNISSYVQSYRIKKTLQSSFLLAQRYIDLNEYFKAKQVLFERLSLLLYHQKGQLNQQTLKNQMFNKLLKKLNISKPQIQQCFDVLQQIIRLERKISLSTSQNHELDGVIKEYVNLGIILSFNSRKQQNFIKSLSILQRIQQFLGSDDQSWLLNLHLGQCFLFAGKLDQAQACYRKSIKYEINQANVCCYIRFYAIVLNWEKAISLLRSYEGLILQEYVYDFLISKILQAKALCTSSKLKQSQLQRTQTFYECLSIAKRIFDRKNVPQILLCESYQLIGDSHFYLKEYQSAFESYEKGLALARSIDYSSKKQQTNQQVLIYEPTYIQKNQMDYSRSLTPHMVQSTFKKTSSIKSAANKSLMSVGSLISQTESKQASFVYQLRFLFNFDKKVILLSSMANCRLMQRKYQQALKMYEEARNCVLSHNLDLKNSIVGNMAICSMEMGKYDRTQANQQKVRQGKQLLQHIIKVAKKQTPSKLQNDVNYIFLLNELQTH